MVTKRLVNCGSGVVCLIDLDAGGLGDEPEPLGAVYEEDLVVNVAVRELGKGCPPG